MICCMSHANKRMTSGTTKHNDDLSVFLAIRRDIRAFRDTFRIMSRVSTSILSSR
jgi:hypothetical protein